LFFFLNKIVEILQSIYILIVKDQNVQYSTRFKNKFLSLLALHCEYFLSNQKNQLLKQTSFKRSNYAEWATSKPRANFYPDIRILKKRLNLQLQGHLDKQ